MNKVKAIREVLISVFNVGQLVEGTDRLGVWGGWGRLVLSFVLQVAVLIASSFLTSRVFRTKEIPMIKLRMRMTRPR